MLTIRTSAVYLGIFIRNNVASVVEGAEQKQTMWVWVLQQLSSLFDILQSKGYSRKEWFHHRILYVGIIFSKLAPKWPKALARTVPFFVREWIQPGSEFEIQLAWLSWSRSSGDLYLVPCWDQPQVYQFTTAHNHIPNCFSGLTSVTSDIVSHFFGGLVYTGFWLHSGEGEWDAWRVRCGRNFCRVETPRIARGTAAAWSSPRVTPVEATIDDIWATAAAICPKATGQILSQKLIGGSPANFVTCLFVHQSFFFAAFWSNSKLFVLWLWFDDASTSVPVL